ncbi:predicted protein [Uncinocarpus reesii 1704]|uniref:Uncharacterized protein n=1 Tax=Uncinocarpus reesii (strain UAMH 1704) TaxID=336963 RepID=C4JZ29_UNCRE|nr:uncharacterized protein UREG_07430 [Uncinocarpus reesii 1704]EEP82565.1 predicted protein [Uncinocarpus reesii 1704]
MSNLDRHQRGLSDRNAENKPSPRANRSSHLRNDSFTSRIPTLTPKNGEKSRIPFTNTRTLTGAFKATAGPPDASDNSKKTARRYTTEGKERNRSATSPSPRIPSPQGESRDTNRRNQSTDGLARHENQTEFDTLPRREWVEQLQNFSPSPGARHHDMRALDYREDAYDSGLSNLDEITDEDLRRRLEQREKDEKRLQRVRGGDQPIFSKAKIGSRAALSTENLLRRDEEVQHEEAQEEAIDEGRNPPLNIPKPWGTRGRATNDWLNRTKRETQNDYMADVEEQQLSLDWENDAFDFTARSLQISDSPPVRSASQYQKTYNAEPLNQPAFSGAAERSPPKQQEQQTHPSDMAKESPIVVYRNNNYERPRVFSKEDSQDLLRRLTRKESPSLVNTPESKTGTNPPLNPKTPVVTGAWVDTPLPKQPVGPPEEKPKPPIPPQVKDSKTQAVEPVEERKEPTPKKVQPKRNPPVILEKPDLPKSALAAVIESVRAGNNEFALGETTIESLQDLLEDTSTSISDTKFPKKTGNISTNTLKAVRPVDEGEEALIDRLNSKLQSLVQNINEAKAGLVSLEDKAIKEAALLATRNPQDSSKKRASHTHKDGAGPS